MRLTTRHIVQFTVALLFIAGGSGLMVRGQAPQAVGTWVPAGAVADARVNAASATLPDGRTLVAGGYVDSVPTATVVIFSPLDHSFVAAGAMSAARVGHTATVLADGRVLIAGGLVDGQATADLEIFDPADGSSAMVGTMNTARSGHAAALLQDVTVLLVGGSDGTAALASGEIFHADSNATTSLNDMSVGRAGLSATTLIDGRVLVAGGNDGTQDLATAEIFNPWSESFELASTSLSLARSGHAAVLLPHNAGVLIAGGSTNGVPQIASDLFLPAIFTDPYSYAQGAFVGTAAASTPRTGAFSGPSGDNGYAFIAAGGSIDLNGQSVVAGNAERYRFATIMTDKDDYAPGERALITGSGWQPGEEVTLLFQEDPAVHDDYTFPVTADSEGNIYWDQWAPELHDLDVRFYLTALASRSRAQITFTDAWGATWSVKLNGGSAYTGASPSSNGTPIAVSPGSSVSASITTSDAGGGQPQTWNGTAWRIATTTGATTCIDTPDATTSPHTVNISMTAPMASGTYNVYLEAHRTGACSQQSSPFVLSNAVVVDGTNPSTASVTNPAGGSTLNIGNVPVTFNGSAADNSGGTGLNANTTTFTLQRPDLQYWTGSAWQSAPINLATTHVATTSGTSATWSSNVTMPTWATEGGGTYRVQARATDKAGNAFTGTAITFTFTAGQTITFNALANKTYGDADFSVSATASSGLTVTFTSQTTGVCTVSGATVHIVSAGTCTVRASQAGNADYSAAPNVDQSFTVNAKAASVTPAAATKVYGEAEPVFTGTLSGFLAADSVTASYSRTAGESVAGSPYTISAVLSPAGVLSNYAITYDTAAFTITPKAASVTPAAASKIYGDADPAFTGALTGFVAADGVTATYSRTTGETVAGGPYTISAVLSPAGVLGNYTITSNTASFTISPRPASVTPAAATKVYGDADPVFTGTLAGFLTADGVTAAYSRTAGETVAAGPYPISAVLSPAGVLGNYTITNNTADLTITPKAASVTPNPASKIYGDADPAFTGALAGFLAADGVSATYSRTPGETVAGGPYPISAVLSPSGVLGNYSVTYNTAALTISPRPASVTPAAASKIYGEADPAFTGTLAGFVAADGVTAAYSRTAGETVEGSPYSISAVLSPAGVLGNYTITANTALFTITPRSASVTPDPAAKAYGDADPAFTGTLAGFLAADGVAATYQRTAGETVAGNPYTISATLTPAGVLANYNIAYNTADFVINAKAASVTPNAASKAYGDADPALTGTLTGFLAADGVAATYSRTAGETVAAIPYTISAVLSPAAVLANYDITYNTAAFTITTRAASVTPNAASKTYGDVDPALTGALDGFLAADGVAATYTRTAGDTVAGSPYVISATLTPAGVLANYNITYNTANFTISPKAASVTPNAASKTYGDADPAFTGSLLGFLAADAVTATYARTAGESVTGGSYTISATLTPAGVLGNYAITYNTAVFAINAKAASVSPNGASKTYGDADPAFTGTLAGFLAADGVAATYTRTAGDTVAGSPYVISATLTPAGVLANYDINYGTADFVINTKAASVTPTAASKTYGDADPAFTGTLSGFLAADGVTATYSRTAGETVAGSPYTISAALAPAGVLSNYAITYLASTLSVSPRPITFKADDLTRVYGQATPAFSYSVSVGTVANSDTFGTPNFSAAGSTAGSHVITLSGLANPNYDVSFLTGTLTITKAPLFVTPADKTKTYGGTFTAFTGTLATVVAGDNITASYASAGAGAAATVATYDITASLNDPDGRLGNYLVTLNPATLTVGPAPLTVLTHDKTREYGVANPAFTGAITGIQNADNITATYTSTATPTTGIGSYPITATLSDPGGKLSNYSVSNPGGTLNITKATLTVTSNNGSRPYGVANPAFSGVIAGIKNGDNITASYASAAVATTPVGAYGPPSPLAIKPALADPASKLVNYTVTMSDGTLTIGAWTAQGFHPPIGIPYSITQGPASGGGIASAPLPAATTTWQVSKGGSTIPLKFNAYVGGVETKNLSDVKSFQATVMSACPAAGTEDTVDYLEPANIGTTLSYDGAQFHQNWKTPQVNKDTCYRVAATLQDNTAIYTFVKLRK